MPGLLSSVFDGDEGMSHQNESTQDYDAGAHGGIDLSPSIAVSHHAEASWQDADGTTHSYESDTDVVFTADASVAFSATGGLTGSIADEG